MTGGALVLAAGASRRFGSDKRQYMLNDKPLLAHCLSAAAEAGLELRVCVAPGETALIKSIAPVRCQYIECSNARSGMGATLAQGVSNCSDWSALLVVLGDMAWVQPTTYAAVFAALDHATIAQPHFAGRPGQPVGFCAEHFPALSELNGDRGGRDLLRRYQDRVAVLQVDDPGILKDIDRPPVQD